MMKNVGRVYIYTHTGDLKNKKGITLIALVITIIVLLILAGVTIATLTGENGLLEKTRIASENTKLAAAKEKIQLAVISSRNNDANLDENMLKENINKIEGLQTQILTVSFPLTVVVDKFEFSVYEDGTVIYTGTPIETGNGLNNNLPVVNNITYEYNSENKKITISATGTAREGSIDYFTYSLKSKSNLNTELNTDSTLKNNQISDIEYGSYIINVVAYDNQGNASTTKTKDIKLKTYNELDLSNSTATASETDPRTAVGNLIDNNILTWWCNNDQVSTSGSIVIDFKKVTEISSFTITCRSDGWYNQTPKNFTLLGSNNGTDYTQIKSFSESYTTAQGLEKKYNLDVPVNYQYYKFDITSSQGGNNLGIAEIRFYNVFWPEITDILYDYNTTVSRELNINPIITNEDDFADYFTYSLKLKSNTNTELNSNLRNNKISDVASGEYIITMGAHLQNGSSLELMKKEVTLKEYLDTSNATATANETDPRTLVGSLIDDDLSTWWCNNDRVSTSGSIVVKFNNATEINSFSMTCRNDDWYNQTPKDFTISGSNNGTDYTQIKSFSESYTTSKGLEKRYYLDVSANYEYYKFDITSAQGGNNLGIAEIRFYK